ncbi:ACT domain-containing protein [Tessaracoccus coleopterorum]|uniref:ACT domain-containing protein n=1 Tax=Tessaracoccus coleopterorum TaxID=2714950 RepID=UPI0018D2FD48|nr:ACT domain-containing protein [Tessaracoccus coleopterorum]
MAGETDLDTLLRGLNPIRREGEFVFATSHLALEAEARIVEDEGRPSCCAAPSPTGRASATRAPTPGSRSPCIPRSRPSA